MIFVKPMFGLKSNIDTGKKDFSRNREEYPDLITEFRERLLQVHGGYGMIRGTTIERFYRDQRLLQIGEGTSEILRVVIARKLGL